MGGRGRWTAGVCGAALACGSPALAQTQTADQPAAGPQAEVVIVTGRGQELYRVEETVTGKLPTEPLESSQSITVLTGELIADQGARSAQDLYRNISGVSFFSYAGVTARGFRQEEIFYDGLRGDPYAGFSVPQLFNMERVEFLKGPAGMLYGPGAPGGLFNYVTKKPEEAFSARAAVVAGTEGRYGASAEVSGALPDGGPAARLGVFYEDQGLPRWNAQSETAIYDGGLSVDLGFADVTVQATRYEQRLDGNRLRGVPVDASGRFLADRRWNHNEASDYLELESNVVQALVSAQPLDGLSIDGGVRYNEATESQKYHEPSGFLNLDNNPLTPPEGVTREFRDQTRPSESVSAGLNAVWSADLGPVQNRLLIGGDWYRETGELIYFRAQGQATAVAGRPTPLTFASPGYGVTNPSAYVLSRVASPATREERAGGYVLEEATLGPVIAVVGARWDTFKDQSGTTAFEDDALTWRAGLVYRARPDVSFFANWAESFEPQAIASQDPRAGGPFDPTEGEMIEGGVKTELFGGRLQSALAVYQITRTNVLQGDPRGDPEGDGVNNSVPFGEVTSEGVEVDVTADITDNWVATVSYAFNDTRITADNGRTALTNSVGDRFANAPEHEAGFWTRYQIPALNLAFALGGDYVDVRRSLSNQKVRPYVVFDASIIYELDDWRALLRVNNLTDETYAASGFNDRGGHFPGAPRSVFVELSRTW
jgi:iron complex outermembrane recepter protein